MVVLEPFLAFLRRAAKFAVLSMRHTPSAWRFLAGEFTGRHKKLEKECIPLEAESRLNLY